MGADLYIKKIWKPNKDKYEPKFRAWVDIRNKATLDSVKDEAQKKVDYYFKKMDAVGYFRDSYNDSDLLWKFGISWWGDVTKMLNKEGELTPQKAKTLLNKLKRLEDVFKRNVDNCKSYPDMPKEKVQAYFIEKYQAFKEFLNVAIKLNEPIDCSL